MSTRCSAPAGRLIRRKVRGLLLERLRVVYPLCEVRIRDPLAGFADAAIYVFRDGKALSTFGSDDWTADRGTARLVTNAAGIIPR